MTTKTDPLAFMNEGPYDATRPTDEQLAAVLPWFIHTTIEWTKHNNYGDYVEYAVPRVLGSPLRKLIDSDGFDRNGRDKAGRDKDGYDTNGRDEAGYSKAGYDRMGFDKAGYDKRGFNKDGYSVDGRDRNGDTKEEAAVKQVKKWSPEHRALIAEELLKRKRAAEAAKETAPAEELAAAAA